MLTLRNGISDLIEAYLNFFPKLKTMHQNQNQNFGTIFPIWSFIYLSSTTSQTHHMFLSIYILVVLNLVELKDISNQNISQNQVY